MKAKGMMLSRKENLRMCEFFFLMFLFNIFSSGATNHLNWLVLESPVSIQQNRDIKGIVVDEKGNPLPGATIVIEGTTRGVITDVDGSFSINATPTDKLSISFVGLQSQVIEVKQRKFLNVVLLEQIDQLDEVTIVAFGKQKKESVLSSISTIKPDELKVPSSNLTTALAGRVSGLISYQRSGEPGQDNADFFIRGVTTFGYTASPLILIDGVEMSSYDLSRLQVDDIASFSIMKDATATALYGARGANGVILVSTKEGKEGKARATVRYETSLSSPTKMVELADPITYMNLHNEAVTTRNPLGIQPYSQEKIYKTTENANPLVYPAIDWYNELFKNYAVNHRVNLNVSGGGKIARYYIAATFNQDNGIMEVDKKNNFNNNIDLKKYLIHSNININISPTTEAIVRFHSTMDDYTGPVDGGSQLFTKVMSTNPVLYPPYFEPDEKNQFTNHILFGNYGTGNYINPYAEMVKGYKEYTTSTVQAIFELKQSLDFITKGLNIRALHSENRYAHNNIVRSYNPFYYTVSNYEKKTDIYTLQALNIASGTEYLGYSEGAKNVETTVYTELAINYDRVFDEKHEVSGMLVGTKREKKIVNAGSLQQSLPYRNLGLSGRATYSFNQRYYVEANFGYNGSERFAKKNRFGFFPSIGTGWIISNEPFYSERLFDIMPKLKLKATYGLVGNDNIGGADNRFFFLSEVDMNSSFTYTLGSEFGYSKPSVAVLRYANPNITWEVSRKTNIGIEINLFNSLDIMADFFKEDRNGILLTRSYIPQTMGLLSTPMANLGEASGHGIDFSIDHNKIFNQDWWLTTRLNFTYATSKYSKFEEPDYSITPWLSKVNQKIGQQWGYLAERLFVDEKEVLNSPDQGSNVMAGDIKYRDINGDGKITTLDRVPIGYPTIPEIVYGFGFSVGYKKIDFSCFFQGIGRESFWIDNVKTAPFIDTDNNNSIISNNSLLKVYADDHWSEYNRNLYALWPRLSDETVTNNTLLSTWFMRDGSFIRLKSLELGYTLPKDLTEKIKISALRFYASGTNLLTISNFKLWDPEMAGNGLGYPIQKVFNLGFQVTL